MDAFFDGTEYLTVPLLFRHLNFLTEQSAILILRTEVRMVRLKEKVSHCVLIHMFVKL